MNCPFCSSDSKVTDSRDSVEGVRRRRECTHCSRRFTTYEKLHVLSSMVRKENGQMEPFSAEKLRNSIRIACAKRKLSFEQVASSVEHRLYAMQGGGGDIPTRRIGELVMEELRSLDRVAYIRFASVYRNFDDAGAFAEEAETLAKHPPVDPAQMKLMEDEQPAAKGSGREEAAAASAAATTTEGKESRAGAKPARSGR